MTVEQIIKENKNDILNFVRKNIHDEDTAQDVNQIILIKIFLNFKNLKNQDRIKPWIYKIARNTIYDHFRKDKTLFSQLDENATISNTPETAENELLNCINPFLNQLKPSYRQALEFTDLGGKTQKELAKYLNVSYSGVKSKVQRARHQLKRLFIECCNIETDIYGSILSVAPKKNHCSCS